MARLSARHCKRPYRSPAHILSTTYDSRVCRAHNKTSTPNKQVSYNLGYEKSESLTILLLIFDH